MPEANEIINAPRHSILVRVPSSSDIKLAYPFFPSYLRMPIRVGEQVWLFIHRGEEDKFYWICRKVVEDSIEDVSYTAFTRQGNNSVSS